MDRETARRKFDALGRMTEARGCTKEEAATAARLAKSLGEKWGFKAESRREPEDLDDIVRRAAAAQRAWAKSEEARKRRHREAWHQRQQEAREREADRQRREEAEFARREEEARKRFGWEYRSCGKRNCHCMKEGTKHGPYKYRKVRKGKTVTSIYGGK